MSRYGLVALDLCAHVQGTGTEMFEVQSTGMEMCAVIRALEWKRVKKSGYWSWIVSSINQSTKTGKCVVQNTGVGLCPIIRALKPESV